MTGLSIVDGRNIDDSSIFSQESKSQSENSDILEPQISAKPFTHQNLLSSSRVVKISSLYKRQKNEQQSSKQCFAYEKVMIFSKSEEERINTVHHYNKQKKMKIFNVLKGFVQSNDFFQSTRMLRFEKQNQYKTLTGGSVSLIIIIVILIGFSNEIIITLNRTSIQYTQNRSKLQEPQQSHIIANPQKDFMFTVQIMGIDFRANKRFFNVYFDTVKSTDGISQYQSHSLVPCTEEHWVGFKSMQNNLKLREWLCPEIGLTTSILGKYTSKKSSILSLEVSACTDNPDLAPCASEDEIKAFWENNGGSTVFGYYYINTIINPDQPEYKQSFIEDTEFAYFGPTMGVEAFVELSDYNINTDTSIWPFQNIVNDKGFYSQNKMSAHYYPLTNTDISYVYFDLKKSAQSTVFTRNVKKISNVLSFIGGIISALLTTLFIMNSYTTFAFEVSIAAEIFSLKNKEVQQNTDKPLQDTKNDRVQLPSISVFTFLKYKIFSLMKDIFKKNLQWPQMKYLNKCLTQIIYQLDIKRLLKRIILMEYSMSHLFDEGQLQGIKRSKPVTPLQIKLSRELFDDFCDSDDEEHELKQRVQQNMNQNTINRNKEPDSSIINRSLKQKQTSYQMNMIMIDNISDHSMNEENPRNISTVNRYLKSRKDLSKDHDINLMKLKDSALQGNDLSKRIWRNIQKSQKLKTQKAIKHLDQQTQVPFTYIGLLKQERQ